AAPRRRRGRDVGRVRAGARRRALAHRRADRSRRAVVPRCPGRRARRPAAGAQVGQLRRRRFLRARVRARAMSEARLRDERRGVPIRAVMLSRLGPNVWAGTPAAAMARLEELEETARLWLDADPKPAPLSPAEIDELRRQFGARW